MKVKGFLYGLIASATFGLIPLFSIPALENGVGLDSLLFYRFSLASVLVAVLMWVKKIPFDIQKSEFGTAFILGTLYAITALWLTEAYLYIPSGVATTIHFLYPDCLCSLHRRYEPKPDRQARQLESHFLYSAFRSNCLSGKSGDKR